QIMNILCEFSPLVEKISIDEAFLDISGTETLYGKPEDLQRE
ncbi:MAG: DNA polymerase IV, partial [Deltaproteobacteria bacterium]